MILGKLLQKLAPKIGARIILESSWNMVGQITFKNGKKSYFKYNALDINTFGSALIAKDKDFSTWFLSEMNYPTVANSEAFFSPYWSKVTKIKNKGLKEAYTYAKQIGFPVIVKPNSGLQGHGVALVYNRSELLTAVKEVYKNDNLALIQNFVKGDDYRFVVLDDKIVSVYKRTPLSIIGDGKTTIEKLIKNKQKQLLVSQRPVNIDLNDYRINIKLKHQNLTLSSKPEKDKVIYLLDSANLSTGGDAIDVTNKVHDGFIKLSTNIAKDMNLRFCGIDMIIDGEISKSPDKFCILEINSSIGLSNYVKLGHKQFKIVEAMYLDILKKMEKDLV